MPGAIVVPGVQLKMPETGTGPWVVAKLAPCGRLVAESVSVDVGMDWSVAFTMKLSVASWLTVSAAGTSKTGGTCLPTWTVTLAVRLRDPLVPVMETA